jgi:CRP/FNR family transcriptional regulator, anaerobic regulatory protein
VHRLVAVHPGTIDAKQPRAFTPGTTSINVPAGGLADYQPVFSVPPVCPPNECAGCPAASRCVTNGSTARESASFARLPLGRRRVRKAQSIYRIGDRFHFMYAVRFGSLKSSTALPDGTEQVVGFHLPGDVVGFDAVATGEHQTTLTALESSEICAIPYSQLSDASAEFRTMRERVMQFAGAELVREHKLLALIAHSHTEERVAAFLVQLSDRMHERGYSPRDFILRMTRAEIGSYLGTTLETVSRALSAFARRGIVKVDRRHIHVLDMDALRACRSYA